LEKKGSNMGDEVDEEEEEEEDEKKMGKTKDGCRG
jgi:hypothetical protein